MPTPAFQSGYPFSFRAYPGNGSTAIFAVPFPYLAQAHVKVYVDNVLQLSGYTWATAGSIQFDTPPPASGDPELPNNVVIRRETPVNPIVTFVNAASLKASNLNVDSKQALYVAQEIADVTIGEAILNQDLLDARDQAVAAAAAAALARDAAVDAQELSEEARDDAQEARDEAQAIVDALSTTYDIAFSVPYLPGAGETVGIYSVNRDLEIPSGALGSTLSCSETGSQDLNLSLYKNSEETAFGTAVLPESSLFGAITVEDSVELSTGDTVTVKVTSANPNAAPSGFGLTLKATLVNL